MSETPLPITVSTRQMCKWTLLSDWCIQIVPLELRLRYYNQLAFLQLKKKTTKYSANSRLDGPYARTQTAVKRNHKNYRIQAMYSTYNVTLRHVHVTTVGSGKAMSIMYFKCVFVALGNQNAIRMCKTVICGLYNCIIFSHIIS
jgi:hypothetical protein